MDAHTFTCRKKKIVGMFILLFLFLSLFLHLVLQEMINIDGVSVAPPVGVVLRLLHVHVFAVWRKLD